MSGHINSLGVAILVENNTGLFLGLCLLALRAHSARTINGRLRWDFIWITLAMFIHLVNSFLIDYAVYVGVGKSVTNTSLAQLPIIIHWTYTVAYMSLPASVMAKLSIIALLLQLQGPQAKKTRVALMILPVLLALTSIVTIFLSLFQCKPVSKSWNIFEDGECPYEAQAVKFLIFQGALNAFADIVLALWPISIVWNLKMSTQSKISFCMLMAITIFTIAAAIKRTIYVARLMSSPDPLNNFAELLLWGSIEAYLVVILGSIPPLRPLFLRMVSKKPQHSNVANVSNSNHPMNEGSDRKQIATYGMTELGEENQQSSTYIK